MLAIIALAGAFIAPRFIQWSDYRDRMEVLASGVLGTNVTIAGDIEFSLLPQPRLHFTDVVVGSIKDPAATVERVDAEFSLVDFLRDNYRVTKLVLDGPVVALNIDESGLFGSGFNIADGPGTSNVVLGQAKIVNGTVRLADRRSGENYVAGAINGELKLAAITGPFQFQGNLEYDDLRYGVRFNTSAMDGDGSNRVTAYAQTDGFSIATEGQLTPGMAPRFEGSITYRQKPPQTDVADDIRGDLVLESKVTASTDRMVLTGYTLQPDENRAGTRLTGAASIQLGARRSFDAVISGGVFGLPPRDASENLASQPYDVVRLLSELPAPLIPPMPGRIGVDLAEVGLRSFALRGVRIDAYTDGRAWAVEQFIAKLPGDTDVRASGTLTADGGHPGFVGKLSLKTERLDALGQMWRKAPESNPLFGLHAAYASKLLLAGDALGFTEGVLSLGGANHALSLRVGFGRERRLDVTGKFGEMSGPDSAAVAALLPDISGNPAFAISFPEGSFGLSGMSANIAGLAGHSMVAEGQWSSDRITFSRLAAADFGGISLDAAVVASGTLAAPTLWGHGKIGAKSGSAAGLQAIYGALGLAPAARELIGLSAPADLNFELAQPRDGGSQDLVVKGKLDTANVDFRASLNNGVAKALESPVTITATLESPDPGALTRQMGFADAAVFPIDDSMFVSSRLQGSLADGFEAHLNASVGEERLGYSGKLQIGASGEVQGTGVLDGYLAEAGGLARLVGAQGLSLPMASGRAELHFEGDRLLQLTAISGKSGDVGFAGELSFSRTGPTSAAAGQITIDSVDLAHLTAAITGPAALLTSPEEIWPTGPMDDGNTPRQTRGSIAVSVPSLTVGGSTALTDAKFDLQWDDAKLRLAHFAAQVGEGQVSADVAVCCSDKLTNKSLSGRLTLSDVQLADILPPDLADNLGGVIDGGLRFSGTGESLSGIAKNLTGEGSFSTADLSVRHLDPQVFPAIAKLDDLLDTNTDALAALIGISLDQGPFTAPVAEGAFTIAGGVLRLSNLSVDGAGGRLAGEASVDMGSLGLNASFSLTPLGFEDVKDLFSQNTARIVSRLSGTLLAPERTLDLDTLVASIQMRVNEIEVARLEALRAEDLARQKAAAEARNKLIAEQRARQQAEEAARLAAEAEQQRLAAEAARQQQEQQQVPQPPLDLGLPGPTQNPSFTTLN